MTRILPTSGVPDPSARTGLGGGRLLWSENFNAVSRDIDREEHSEYWFSGGRGSGKSTFIARKLVLGLLGHPEASALVCRKVAATLRQSVYEELTKASLDLGLAPWCTFRLAPLEIRLGQGQRILFRGADDPGKTKSIALSRGWFGYLWFEELAEFDGMADIATIRASVFRGKCGQRPITFCSYNPPASARSWVNAEALAPRPERLVHRSTYLELPREWIGEGFIADAEALRAADERAWRHMYLGEVTGTDEQVFDNLELRAIESAELEELADFYNGLDFGFASDPDALTRWAYSPRRRTLYAVAEYVARRDPLEVLAARARNVAGREVVWCDSEEPRAIAGLRERGIAAVAVRKGPGSVRQGLEWLCRRAAIVVDPARTPNIAREFAAYEYPRDRMGALLPDPPDRDNHTIDSARYALSPLILARRATTRSDFR